MKVFINKIEKSEEEKVVVQCYKISSRVQEIIQFVKSTDTLLTGYLNNGMTQINLVDIFYLEAVDNKVFAYTKNETYELKCKLYEFEEDYAGRHFFRCAKSCIVNLMKVKSVQPALNGRYSALLFNEEEIVISRQYAAKLKIKLLRHD